MLGSRVLILDLELVFSKEAGGIKKSEFFHALGTGSIYQILIEDHYFKSKFIDIISTEVALISLLFIRAMY